MNKIESFIKGYESVTIGGFETLTVAEIQAMYPDAVLIPFQNGRSDALHRISSRYKLLRKRSDPVNAYKRAISRIL